MVTTIVSIIIPIYNVENYLEQCLASVVNQTYKNLQIIIINDCSTDNSLSIINKYVEKDNRITLIQHKVNKGLGEARNTGMYMAKGKYISFIDSDDYIDLYFVENMLHLISKYDCDVATCSFTAFDATTEHIHLPIFLSLKNTKEETPFSANDTEGDILIKDFITPVWNKLYLTDFIFANKLKFNTLICEDVSWGIEVIFSAKKIIYTNKSLLWYRSNRKNDDNKKSTSSLSHVTDIKICYDLIKNFEISYEFLRGKSNFYYIKEHFLYFVYKRALWVLERADSKEYDIWYELNRTFLLKLNITEIKNDFIRQEEKEHIKMFINSSASDYKSYLKKLDSSVVLTVVKKGRTIKSISRLTSFLKYLLFIGMKKSFNKLAFGKNFSKYPRLLRAISFVKDKIKNLLS